MLLVVSVGCAFKSNTPSTDTRVELTLENVRCPPKDKQNHYILCLTLPSTPASCGSTTFSP
jgi:hypothetical protein